jgi:hypothetical protein
MHSIRCYPIMVLMQYVFHFYVYRCATGLPIGSTSSHYDGYDFSVSYYNYGVVCRVKAYCESNLVPDTEQLLLNHKWILLKRPNIIDQPHLISIFISHNLHGSCLDCIESLVLVWVLVSIQLYLLAI